jgi:restriction system protein
VFRASPANGDGAPVAIPTYDQFIGPLLSFLASKTAPVRAQDAHDAIAEKLGLTEDEKKELLPSGGQSVYANRDGWAHDRLKRAGLSTSARRGVWQITAEGTALATKCPQGLPPDEIERLARLGASGLKLRPDGRPAPEQESAAVGSPSHESPEERIEGTLAEVRDSVAEDLLAQIARGTPAFFESLVLDLLHAMGYGTSRADLQRVGRAGDGGIDGVISLDRLGLQKVYVQAKRWNGSVGGPDVRDFIGTLSTRGAEMGVFLTTSTFTADARDTAGAARTGTVVLIDGERLADLMIDNRVGVTHKELRVPTIDGDYFEG